MGVPIAKEVRQAIAADVRASEFRAGEFYYMLARKHGVSYYTVRQIAVQTKRAARQKARVS